MREITDDLSFQLVGQFMHAWNSAEIMLDRVIATSLELEIVQSSILSPNIPFGNKVDIAKSLVVLSTIKQEEKKHYNRILGQFVNMSHDRNIVAHNVFFPTADSLAVRFFSQKVKTKDIIELPEIVWK